MPGKVKLPGKVIYQNLPGSSGAYNTPTEEFSNPEEPLYPSDIETGLTEQKTGLTGQETGPIYAPLPGQQYVNYQGEPQKEPTYEEISPEGEKKIKKKKKKKKKENN